MASLCQKGEDPVACNLGAKAVTRETVQGQREGDLNIEFAPPLMHRVTGDAVPVQTSTRRTLGFDEPRCNGAFALDLPSLTGSMPSC